jgi:hypothetical protein
MARPSAQTRKNRIKNFMPGVGLGCGESRFVANQDSFQGMITYLKFVVIGLWCLGVGVLGVGGCPDYIG